MAELPYNEHADLAKHKATERTAAQLRDVLVAILAGLPESPEAGLAQQATLGLLAGDGLTRGQTNDVTVATVAKAIVAAAEDVTVRLHSLTVVMETAHDANTWQVEDSDGAVLFGPLRAPALGGGMDRGGPVNRLNVIVAAAVGKGLSVRTAGSAARFNAVYSTATS